jgi:hypothetical protein
MNRYTAYEILVLAAKRGHETSAGVYGHLVAVALGLTEKWQVAAIAWMAWDAVINFGDEVCPLAILTCQD